MLDVHTGAASQAAGPSHISCARWQHSADGWSGSFGHPGTPWCNPVSHRLDVLPCNAAHG
eukprot:scaffold77266_cov19-Tisochrysis_lutea.AAC.1